MSAPGSEATGVPRSPGGDVANTDGVTLARYLLTEQALHPDTEPEFWTLLAQMAYVAKVIARETRRAALVGRLGLVGERNPTGDTQKKLDLFANETAVNAFHRSGLVAAIVSEEMDEPKETLSGSDARYLLCIDPLDGSSNTDTNGVVGTIFGFFRRSCQGRCSSIEAELREGTSLAAAGYVLYGPSTVFVYTRGRTVRGFTLDQDLGEFLLSHDAFQCPSRGHTYSANLGRMQEWDPGIQRFVAHLGERDPGDGRPYALRYSGAAVADVHRTLIEGGIYFYPADAAHQEGKLRLLYEGAPLALVVETAGGRASTGRQPIAEITPSSIHQQVPVALGSREDVQRYERFAAGKGR